MGGFLETSIPSILIEPQEQHKREVIYLVFILDLFVKQKFAETTDRDSYEPLDPGKHVADDLEVDRVEIKVF